MELEVKVSKVSIEDVIATSVDWAEDQVTGITLGNVISMALVEELKKDPRWQDLAQKLADAADWWMDHAAPGYVEALVKAEVARQLESAAQGAVTRGKPSTRAEAMISTEVTTQLRGQFAPMVDAALRKLSADLDALRLDALTAFKRGTGTA